MTKPSKMFKRALGAAAVAGLFAASISDPAIAYESDPHWRVWESTTYRQFVTRVTNQFFEINQHMSDVRGYLTNGDGETGRGVIGAITKTSDADRKFQEENTANEHSRMQVLAMNQAMAIRVAGAISNPRDCYEMPKRIGARMGGGGAGSNVPKGRTEARVAATGAGTQPSEVAHAAAIYGNHKNNGFCSSEDTRYAGVTTGDASRNAFGCDAAGPMPDGDARAQGLFVPAHDYTNAAEARKVSVTFDNGQAVNGARTQRNAADETIANIVNRFSPPALPKHVEQTPAGRILLTKQKVFNARLSTAVGALSTIAAMRDAAANPMSSQTLARVWGADVDGVYSRVFPGVQKPEKPSELEVLRYEVMRRYADYGDGSWAVEGSKQSDQTKRQLMQMETEAVQLNLLYQIHSRLGENNAIQSAILAQMVNPISKDELEKSARAALQAK